MHQNRDTDYMGTMLSSHVGWGRMRIEFWKHLIMVEATILGLTAALRSQQLGGASTPLLLTWWTLGSAIALGCLVIWVQIQRWQDHEMFNLWSVELSARIDAMRREGDPNASLLAAFRDDQLLIWTARLFPEIVDPTSGPKNIPAPSGTPVIDLHRSASGPLSFLTDTSRGASLLIKGFVGLSLAALILLITAVSVPC